MTTDFSGQRVDLALEADFRLGRIHVRPSTRQIESGGNAETLEPRIMQVLVVLSRKRGQVVSRDELIETCWEGRIVGGDALNRCISKIRKLGEAGHDFRIEAIARVGYRLWMQDADVPPVQATSPAKAPGWSGALTPLLARVSRSNRRLLWVAGGLGLIALFGLAVWFVRLNSRTIEVTPIRIALAPFEAIGGAKADAVAQSAPAVVADVLLRAGEPVMSPSTRQLDASAPAAVQLGGSYAVEGSVVETPTGLSLTTRVTNIDGMVIWSREQSASADDVDALAARSATRVANAFRWLRGVPVAGPDVGALQASRLRAAERFLESDDLAAYDEARRAVAARPDDVEPRIRSVWLAANALGNFPPEQRMEIIRTMREDAARAEAIDPSAPAMATMRYNQLPPGEWITREAVVRKGLVDEPDSAEMPNYLASFLLTVGRAAEAAPFARQAVARDSVSPAKAWTPLRVMMQSGRYTEALKESAELLQRWPDHNWVVPRLFEIHIMLGDFANARALLADPSVRDLIAPPAEVTLAETLLKATETRSPQAAREFAAACRQPTILSRRGQVWCLVGLSILGDLDGAFVVADSCFPEWRASTREERDRLWAASPVHMQFIEYAYAPPLAALREDPRMVAIFGRLGLLDYWRESAKWPDFCKTEPRSICSTMQGKPQ